MMRICLLIALAVLLVACLPLSDPPQCSSRQIPDAIPTDASDFIGYWAFPADVSNYIEFRDDGTAKVIFFIGLEQEDYLEVFDATWSYDPPILSMSYSTEGATEPYNQFIQSADIEVQSTTDPSILLVEQIPERTADGLPSSGMRAVYCTYFPAPRVGSLD